MESERLNPKCIECLLEKYLKVPEEADDALKLQYMQKVFGIISKASLSTSTPELVAQITALRQEIFCDTKDFTEIKRHFNRLMLEQTDWIKTNIESCADPFLQSIRYAMLGNYIDFGAMDCVSESKLRELLQSADTIQVNNDEYKSLSHELQKAKSLVYLTDNCGEIAMDRLLIEQILKDYPNCSVTVMVRGEPVLNDATLDDAKQVGLCDLVSVIPNGSNIAGTCLNKISYEAKRVIDTADVIIAKGQGNFESLRFCGKNIYYLFLCKCDMFANRFGVEKYSGILCNDRRI